MIGRMTTNHVGRGGSVGAVRVALVDSGLGLVACAAAVRDAAPNAELVLSLDPDAMPWGARSAAEVAERALLVARAAAAHDPDVLVLACNTASVVALAALRAELEPELPVVGTVPAIKPAAAAGGPVAVWATPVTTGSAYQRDLIARHAEGVAVVEVACPGLAEAIERGTNTEIDARIADAVARTPPGTAAVVIGCTHYSLVADRIAAALGPGITLFDSARPVAAQALRRAAVANAAAASSTGPATPIVLLSGRPGALPARAGAFALGRRLGAPAPAASPPG